MEGEYYKTQASVQQYIRMAEGFNGGELITQLKQVLPLNLTVLEIGSGPGTDWNILNETYVVTGSDNSAVFIEHLRKSYPDGQFLELDASTLATDQRFDGIYSNKVMHHLTNDQLAQSVNNQAKLLNSKGIICHSFWKGEGSEVFKGLFVNYHTENGLRDAFGLHFDVISVMPYEEFEAGDSLLLIGRRK
ncbi:MAG: class I SAM-dependent methyltransferase [Cyclobacteriaceae bacterium]